MDAPATAPPSTPARGARPVPARLVLLVVSLGIFVGGVDQYVIASILPKMLDDLGVPPSDLARASWAVTGYILGFVVAMPLVGRMADVYGLARIYLASLVVFLIGSLLAATATSLNWLIAARLIQGIGGGAEVPVGIAMIASLYPAHKRALPLGVIAAVAEAGSVVGPLWGSAALSFASWRLIFWLNLPIGLSILILRYFTGGRTARPRVPIDYVGAALFGGALAALVVGLWTDPTEPRPVWVTIACSVLALALLATFIWWELRTPAPLLRLGAFRDWTFSAANLTNLLVGAALIIALVDVPFFFNSVFQRPPDQAGQTLIYLVGVIWIGGLLGGSLTQWLSRRWPALAFRLPVWLGLGLTAAAFLLMAQWARGQADQVVWQWSVPGAGWPLAIERFGLDLMLAGLGFGLVIAPIATATVNAARRAETAIASSLVTIMRMIGMAIGLAWLTTWALSRYSDLIAGLQFDLSTPEGQVAYIEAQLQAARQVYHSVFYVAAGVCLAALVVALGLGWRSGEPLREAEAGSAATPSQKPAVSPNSGPPAA